MTEKMTRVAVATPVYDGTVAVEFMISLMETSALLAQCGISLDFLSVRGDAFVDKARNYLVAQFLETGDDQLFFVDADQGWDAAGFVRMVIDPRPIVAGVVPKKSEEIVFNNPALDTDEAKNCFIENGLLRASQIGTGFMRIRREAIMRMIEAYPDQYSPGDGSPAKHHRLFEAGVIDGQFWGEDLSFCRKWAALGEKIWIDPNVSFKHVGRKAYEGNFLNYLRQHGCVTEGPQKPLPVAAE